MGLTPHAFPWCLGASFAQGVFEPFKFTAANKHRCCSCSCSCCTCRGVWLPRIPGSYDCRQILDIATAGGSETRVNDNNNICLTLKPDEMRCSNKNGIHGTGTVYLPIWIWLFLRVKVKLRGCYGIECSLDVFRGSLSWMGLQISPSKLIYLFWGVTNLKFPRHVKKQTRKRTFECKSMYKYIPNTIKPVFLSPPKVG